MRKTLMVKTKGLGDTLATVALEHPRFAVIGTGATETIASLQALEVIMNICFSKFGHHCRQGIDFFLTGALCLSAGRGLLRLTRLPRHDRGPVRGGNRSAASCLCTVLRRALYHYSTRSPHCRQGIEVAPQKKLHTAPCHCRT